MHKVKNPLSIVLMETLRTDLLKVLVVLFCLNLSFDFVLNCRLSTLNKNTHFKSVYC